MIRSENHYLKIKHQWHQFKPCQPAVLKRLAWLIAISLIFNIFAVVPPAYAVNNDAMMVYDVQSITSIPKYRQWTGSWGGEGSASAVSGEIKYMELKFSPVADIAILVTQGSNGVISAQTWTGGATNSWGSVTTIGTVGGGTIEATTIDNAELYRCFDFEFERSSGDAIIVYGDGTADPNYQTYTGGAWSGGPGTDINIATAGTVHWIEVASHPSTDRLALITLASNGIYGMRWDGSTWDDMNAGGTEAVWDATPATFTRKCIDVAFETTTSDIIFMWADATQDQQIYREYSQSGSTLTAVTTVTIANQAGLGNWVRLAADPTAASDRIMYACQDASLDLFSAYWSGIAWTVTAAAHDTSMENVMSMQVDIIWETDSTNPNEGFMIWGDGTVFNSRHWTNANPPVWDAIDTTHTNDDDTAVVRMVAQPANGDILALVYQDSTSISDDLLEAHITDNGTDFSAQVAVWSGPVVTNTAAVSSDCGFRVAVEPERYEASLLGVTAPNSITLTTGNPGDTKETTWGTGEKVVVTDAGSGWTLTIIMQTTLTSGGYTIPDANVKIRKDGNVNGIPDPDVYTIWSGVTTAITETNTIESLDISRTVGIRSTGTNGDQSEVRPTIQVVLPVGQHPADYAGSMRFTVA